jgi:SAM-dependent methyltransferase
LHKYKNFFRDKVNDKKYDFIFTKKKSSFFNTPFTLDCYLDNFIKNKSVYDLDEKYDLITSFLSLGVFNIEKLFQQISRLLKKGGNFFFLVRYYWYPVNALQIYGATPYACQIFNYEELIQHYKKFIPQDVHRVKNIYFSFHEGKKPVLQDYIEIAKKYKLKIMFQDRIKPTFENSYQTNYTPQALVKKNFDFDSTLKRIKNHYPKVNKEDLFTGWVSCYFVKE